jgi:hypothetical protein
MDLLHDGARMRAPFTPGIVRDSTAILFGTDSRRDTPANDHQFVFTVLPRELAVAP